MNERKSNLLIKLDKITIKGEIIYRKRKTLEIRILEDNSLRIVSPIFLNEKEVIKSIRKKEKWIIEKMKRIEDLSINQKEKKFVQDEVLLYLGKEYYLNLEARKTVKSDIFIANNNITVTTNLKNEKEHIKKLIESWYKKEFNKILDYYINKHKIHINKKPNKIRVKNQKTLWGSCSSKNNLNFNWKLIMAPKNVIEYVVIHELCHLQEKNHGKNFWKLVEKLNPMYKENRSWLKSNGHLLEL